ncbi:hypothetical protein HPB50_009505 [Hyalomma asiaticum]|uniref:Uncharacterized protein n=1 Tax=Hyalomma asiaticum TaxID=266040 RepID=A0ACB7RHY2_HYAAI|nr:hypothetical protein HPB50_009505 [Hyalomma asiaticum]
MINGASGATKECDEARYFVGDASGAYDGVGRWRRRRRRTSVDGAPQRNGPLRVARPVTTRPRVSMRRRPVGCGVVWNAAEPEQL